MSNQRRLTALMVVALAAVIATGGLVASNMGFKLNYPLEDSSGSSNSGTQTIGLPYNRQVGIDTASDLFKDVVASGISAASIQEYNPVSDANDPYSFGLMDFALNKGEGYLIRVLSSGDYIIVGSHDPGFTVNLERQGTNGSNSGTQRYAHPYHGVSDTASELFKEIGTSVTASVQQYNSVSDANDPYSFGLMDFALEPGASYLVRVLSDHSFVPAHY